MNTFKTDSKKFITSEQASRIRVWSLNDEYENVEPILSIKDFSLGVRYACSNSNDSVIAACGEDHSLRIIVGNKVKEILTGHKGIVTSADFIDDSTVVTSCWDQTINIYKI